MSDLSVSPDGWEDVAAGIEPMPRCPSVRQIQRATCEFYSVPMVDMLSHRRTKELVRPRQVAMYLSRKLTLRTLPAIGMSFDGRDHTTVLHGARKIEAQIAEDTMLASHVAAIEAALTHPKEPTGV